MSRLGPRNWYRYDSNNGKDYRIETQDYLAEAAGLVREDNLPIIPRRMTPRYVWVQSVEPDPATNRYSRKKLVLNKASVPNFRPRTIVKVDGIEMQVMSYRGESHRGAGPE